MAADVPQPSAYSPDTVCGHVKFLPPTKSVSQGKSDVETSILRGASPQARETLSTTANQLTRGLGGPQPLVCSHFVRLSLPRAFRSSLSHEQSPQARLPYVGSRQEIFPPTIPKSSPYIMESMTWTFECIFYPVTCPWQL